MSRGIKEEVRIKKDPRAEEDDPPAAAEPRAERVAVPPAPPLRPSGAMPPVRPSGSLPARPPPPPVRAPSGSLRAPTPPPQPAVRPRAPDAARLAPPVVRPSSASFKPPAPPRPPSDAGRTSSDPLEAELPGGRSSAPPAIPEVGAAGTSARRRGHEAPALSEADKNALADPFGIVGTTQAGSFQVEKVVAHGGFGVIYRARHVGFRAPVALKCLKIPGNLEGADRDQFLERFRSEGEVMFRLSTSIPEVVRPLQVDFLKLDDGRFVPFIALEWLEGETLKDVIVRRLTEEKPPIPLAKAVPYLTPVARALARAHAFPGPDGQKLAIVHCDLKPDNFFVARQDAGDAFKIFDFGIAKVRLAASREAGGFTKAGNNMFTPAYAAPEQWAPDRFGQTGAWTDVYAFALTLAELVTQRPAIDGSPASMLRQALDENVRPTPRTLGLAVSDEVDAVFRRALAVHPKDRTQRIDALWTELEDALGLPNTFGGRSSVTSMPAPPPSWDTDEPKPALPHLTAPPVARSVPAPAPSHRGVPVPSAPPNTPSLAGLELGLDVPPPPKASDPPPPPPPAQPAGAAPAAALGALESDPPEGGPSGLDLDGPAVSVPPAPALPSGLPTGAELPAGPQRTASGAMPAVGSPLAHPQNPLDPPALDAPAPPPVSARLGAAASAAASKAGEAASKAARTVVQKALEVDQRHKIEIDRPETWLRPMRGPLIALGVAILITVVAIVVNRTTEAQWKVTWISAPLIFASVGYAVYRWIKLQQ